MSLVNRTSSGISYPFKVFTDPSPAFFALVANVLAPVLAAAFAVAAVFLSRRSPVATPLVLTFLLPVVFALGVVVVTVISHGIPALGRESNFDGYTGVQVLREYSMNAASLSALALMAGGLASALVVRVRPRQEAAG